MITKSNINALNNTDLTDATKALPSLDTHVSDAIKEATRLPKIDLGVDATIGNQLEAIGKLSLSYFSITNSYQFNNKQLNLLIN